MTRPARRSVILVDEYDHPLIETMHDEERLESHRLLLKSIYVNIKDLDQYIRFTMLTGVSRFSKMTIFSGLEQPRGHLARQMITPLSAASRDR